MVHFAYGSFYVVRLFFTSARLVARGFTQIYGTDYIDTFARVSRLSSIRTIFAVACRNRWPIDVFDFSSAFLNAKLDETIYLEQPPHHEFDDRRKYVEHKLLSV